MKDRKENKIWSQPKKLWLSIVSVLFLTLFLVQGLAFMVMEAEGVYYYEKKDVLYNVLESRVYRDTESMLFHYLNILDSSGETEAYNSTVRHFGSGNLSYEIIRSAAQNKDDIETSDTKKQTVEFAINTPNQQADYVYTISFAGYNSGTENVFYDEMENYTVVSNVNSELTCMDYYGATIRAFDLAYLVRYPIFFTILLSLIVGVWLLVQLARQAGHRVSATNEENTLKLEAAGAVEDRMVLHIIDKLPLDLTLVISLGLIGITINFLYDEISFDGIDWMFRVLPVVGGVLVIVTIGFWQILDMAVRVKAGTWWRNSLIYRCGSWLFHMGRGFVVGVMKNSSIVWKAVVAMLALSALELCFILLWWDWSEPDIMVAGFVVEKIVLIALIAYLCVQWKRLQEGSRRIAQGDLNYQVDTTKMPEEFRKYAMELNHIGEGMQHAVEERMKSEHFKTELITNVSHDIKTPLTSIINYVDLLEKEEIPNEKVQEYLEVLSRQSARLKKLIEDLIEASKASTGALKVQMEECSVGVMLTQAAGEYEERLKKNGMELILKQPETDVLISADGRHLWRVFDNLMNNINKYAQPQTRVYLNLEQVGDRVMVTFRNTSKVALNITSEELQERFVRGDSSRNTEGSGLGLSIARSMTELMQGQFNLIIDGDLFKVILSFPARQPEYTTVDHQGK